MLHAHIQDIAGISCDTADDAGYRSHSHESRKRGLFRRRRKPILELFVHAKTGHAVCELAELGGRETAVEGSYAVVFGDVDEHLEHVALDAIALGLEADLDYIQQIISYYLFLWEGEEQNLPRSKGCVKHAAKQLALPPNQNG